ncbi:hypothetical protein [Flavobacterium sp. Root420]|uniref:hypothetical protein n=1 Tax=Flavobacterium sp. Root420 TaxID=1736533 RepID=UPI0006F60B18|nr:hypothetical protein [Flavobacterium sp. Root420]KQW98615.1 hypothetical protein ASC72_14030 [Flavobacterium sp. Root420]
MNRNTFRGKLELNINTIIESNKFYIDSEIFSANFKTIIEKYCENKIAFSYYIALYKKALAEARNGNITSAALLIEKACKNVDFTFFSEDEINVYKLQSFTIDAYMLYKKEDFFGSIQKTFEVMELDNLFESEFPFIYFHKIQQLQNISRVYLKCSDYQNFTKTIDLMFQNLLFNHSVKFEDELFTSKNLDLNLDLRILMTYQVFFETIRFLEKSDENELHHFNACFKTILVNRDKESVFTDLNGILHWAAIKNDLLNNETISESLIDNYLHSSKKFTDEVPTLSLLRSLKNNLVPQK